MGLLDDAIREHLDLIRRRGASDSEVQRLEDEAFGPPTRPDEADFPEPEEAHQALGNGVPFEESVEEEAVVHEDVTTLLPSAEDVDLEAEAEPAEEHGAEPPEEGPSGLEAPTGAHVTEGAEHETDDAAAVQAEEPEGFFPGEEPVAEEHEILEEPPREQTPPPYDAEREEDLDLDLESEDEPSREQAAPEPPPESFEPPIESLETVEHPVPEEIEGEDAEAESEPSGDGEEESEGDDDVLADTPEFLKDQPEDDELWFEQGEPKDFDF